MRLGSYPVYHSIHDNYNWMVSFVDPEFNYNKLITQIWVGYTLTLLDKEIIPFNTTRYCEELLYYVRNFEASYGEILVKNGVDTGKRFSNSSESNPMQVHIRFFELPDF